MLTSYDLAWLLREKYLDASPPLHKFTLHSDQAWFSTLLVSSAWLKSLDYRTDKSRLTVSNGRLPIKPEISKSAIVRRTECSSMCVSAATPWGPGFIYIEHLPQTPSIISPSYPLSLIASILKFKHNPNIQHVHTRYSVHKSTFFELVSRTPFCLLVSASVLSQNDLNSLDRASAKYGARTSIVL